MKKIVAGIYIQRDGATVIVAQHDDYAGGDVARLHTDNVIPRMGPELEAICVEPFAWNTESPDEALLTLREIAKKIAIAFPETHSVALAGFGTFISLMRSSEDYGRIHKKYGHEPLKGVHLHSEFRKAIFAAGMSEAVKVSVHTDAQAFTLGEAIVRKNPRNHLLVGILCTEGIGGGIVRGNSTFQSALHPEFGLMMPRIHEDDFMRPEPGDRLFAKSLEEVASNKAMRKRLHHERGGELNKIRNSDLRTLRDRKHWEIRAYYLAQLCFVCTCLLTPHAIVLASDLDPQNRLLEAVQRNFDDITQTRDDDRQPMLDYEQFRDSSTFLSSLSHY